LESSHPFAVFVFCGVQYLVCICAASVAELEEAKRKVEEEKAAAEEARTLQQLHDNARVSCLLYS